MRPGAQYVSSRFAFLRVPTEKCASLLLKFFATRVPTCPVTPNTSRLLEVFILISFVLVFFVGIGLGLRGARRRAHMAANLGLNVSGHFESMFAVRRPVRTRVFRHSTAASLRLVLPLGIGQAPPAPERLVDPDVREEPVTTALGQRVLCRVE